MRKFWRNVGTVPLLQWVAIALITAIIVFASWQVASAECYSSPEAVRAVHGHMRPKFSHYQPGHRHEKCWYAPGHMHDEDVVQAPRPSSPKEPTLGEAIAAAVHGSEPPSAQPAPAATVPSPRQRAQAHRLPPAARALVAPVPPQTTGAAQQPAAQPQPPAERAVTVQEMREAAAQEAADRGIGPWLESVDATTLEREWLNVGYYPTPGTPNYNERMEIAVWQHWLAEDAVRAKALRLQAKALGVQTRE